MEFKIEKITSKTSVLLSYKSQPIDPYQPLWQPDAEVMEENGSRCPAAFIIGDKSARLEAVIQPSVRELSGGEYILEGSFKEASDVKFRGICRNTPGTSLLFEVTAKPGPMIFFRAAGLVKWKLIPKNNNGKTHPCGETYLELFWVYGFNYVLFRKGIPVEILRKVAYYLQLIKGIPKSIFSLPPDTKSVPPADILTRAVVLGCSSSQTLSYDIYSTHSFFTTLQDFDNIAFHLEEYLNAIYFPMAYCNCLDQAALIQVYLMAVGMEEVRFCYIDQSSIPSGIYLRLSYLVGWGLCNNPHYVEKKDYILESGLIIERTSALRKPFHSHAFCCLPDAYSSPRGGDEPVDENGKDHTHCDKHCLRCQVLDSCVGPHTGAHDIDEYLKKVIDDVIPGAGSGSDNYGKIKNFVGITAIDWVPAIELEKTNVLAADSTPDSTQGNDYWVVCLWPDPGSWPVLDPRWKILFEKTMPGSQEVVKTWRLQKKAQHIRIEMTISSKTDASAASKVAIKRFYMLLSLSPDLKPAKISFLGKYSARFVKEDYHIYVWVTYNVTFRIICHKVEFNVHALLLWLKELAFAHREKEIEKYLPPAPELEQDAADEVTITINNRNAFIDFCLEGDGLRLLDADDQKLQFKVINKSKAIVTAAAVDRRTLLTNSRQFSFNKMNKR